VLVADVVGYSRLMADDEAGTLLCLRERLNTILEPTIASHQGRIVKLGASYGDVPASFNLSYSPIEIAVGEMIDHSLRQPGFAKSTDQVVRISLLPKYPN
jgi:hypothetical protein